MFLRAKFRPDRRRGGGATHFAVRSRGRERGGAGGSVLEAQHGGPGQQQAALQNTVPAHHPRPHLALE